MSYLSVFRLLSHRLRRGRFFPRLNLDNSQFHRKDIRAWLASGVFTSLAGAMLAIISPWIALELTGSPSWVGVLIGLPAIVSLPTTFLGGSVADKSSKRTILVIAQVGSALSLLALAAIAFLNLLTIWPLLFFVILNRSIQGFGFPADSTLIAELVDPSEIVHVQAGRGTLNEVSQIIGAGVGGLALAILGPATTLTAVAILYGISVPFLLQIKISNRPGRSDEPSANMRLVLRKLLSSPILRVLFALALIDLFTVFFFPIIPVIVSERLNSGETELGILMAFFAAGGAAVGAVLAIWRITIHAPLAIVVGNLGWGLAMIGLLGANSVAITASLVVAMGAFGTITGIAWSSLALSAIPSQMRGRMFSLFNIAFQAFFVGAIFAGVLTSILGVDTALLIGAIGTIFATALVWLSSQTFRNANALLRDK